MALKQTPQTFDGVWTYRVLKQGGRQLIYLDFNSSNHDLCVLNLPVYIGRDKKLFCINNILCIKSYVNNPVLLYIKRYRLRHFDWNKKISWDIQIIFLENFLKMFQKYVVL